MKIIKRISNKLGIYRTYPHTVAGKTFRVPIYKGIGHAHFMDAEPWMDDVLKLTGKDAVRFLDVGVNVGQTLLKWKALYPASTYVGFEPNHNCLAYLNDLIQKNQLKNCTIHPYGISTKKTDAHLYLLGRDPGDSSASTIENLRADENRLRVPVQLIPLKEVEQQPFDLIKIDVEGSELEVLQSIFDMEGEPVIICEILPVYSEKNNERLKRQMVIERLLAANDYCIYSIVKTNKITLEKKIEFGIHGDVSLSDYIFIPQAKEAAIIANFN